MNRVVGCELAVWDLLSVTSSATYATLYRRAAIRYSQLDKRFKSLQLLQTPDMEYEPIQGLPGGDHIRILSIAPSANLSDPIHVELSVVKLADQPFFNALSYVWGTSTEKVRKSSLDKTSCHTLANAMTQVLNHLQRWTVWCYRKSGFRFAPHAQRR